MEQIHGHEVLHMMEGNVYSEASLRQAIIARFGAKQLFYTCSASELTVDGLIEFLKEHGKFKPVGDCFTVDETSVCSNE
ncbi:MAG: YecH family protein [Bacteroidaceae bacterium]|nr:YecH family protein [Bacteroidaceae bacterium]